MSWVLQALAQLVGSEPAPGTPAHREAYMRSCKLLIDAMAKPPAQRDVAWMVEEAKRNMRLRGEYHQVRAQPRRSRHPWLGCRALPLLPCFPRAAAAPAQCLQAEAQMWRRELELWTQRLAAWQAEPASACCPDFVRVHQRMLASLHAGASLLEAWAQQSTVRLQALQEGRPPPPAPPPRLELDLPAGLPQELPPSIDRCAVCQEHLEHVSCRGWVMVQHLSGRHLEHMSCGGSAGLRCSSGAAGPVQLAGNPRSC